MKIGTVKPERNVCCLPFMIFNLWNVLSRSWLLNQSINVAGQNQKKTCSDQCVREDRQKLWQKNKMHKTDDFESVWALGRPHCKVFWKSLQWVLSSQCKPSETDIKFKIIILNQDKFWLCQHYLFLSLRSGACVQLNSMNPCSWKHALNHLCKNLIDMAPLSQFDLDSRFLLDTHNKMIITILQG